jgi:hypothetical protein
VQALAGVAHEVGQPALDVQVHVLVVERPGERAGRDLDTDRREPALDVGQVAGRQDAGAREHAGVGERAVDIGVGQAAVEPHRGGVALDEISDRLGEAAGPSAGGGHVSGRRLRI